jgi:hypothetical protein
VKDTPRQPSIYEINTPVFLREISARVGYPVTLADVPDNEWDLIARPGIDTIWFMGVWKRSLAARKMATNEVWLKEALPDASPEDIIGSAYSIQEYVVDASFGGNVGLAVARAKLRARGIGIMLDYVPNHVGIDHTWVTEHPDYFLLGTGHELAKHSEAFVQTAGGIFAKGKDPNFEPWSDVLQLNAFSIGFRQKAIATLQTIAGMCDGVRCDMAMLMMNTIFKSTWGERVGDIPAEEYWPSIISAVRQVNPDFLFLAEVYWGKQQDMLDQGFDLCYDKDLYDLLLDGSVHRIKKHLSKPVSYQLHLLRFLENHDETRAAHAFPLNKHFAAAVIIATLPGAHLYYDGQREGRSVKLPVHLSRRVTETANNEIIVFYDKLFSFVQSKRLYDQKWHLVTATSKLLHFESHHVLAWVWATEMSQTLIAVNYSHEKAQVSLGVELKKVRSATDILTGEVAVSEYISGSCISLEPWQHVVIEL